MGGWENNRDAQGSRREFRGVSMIPTSDARSGSAPVRCVVDVVEGSQGGRGRVYEDNGIDGGM